jgi:hypothetical protein
MRRLIWGILAILLAPPALAQRPHRSGWWGEFGAGPGLVRVACSGCNDVVSAQGPTSYIRIGGTASDHVLIGFEAFGLAQGRGSTRARTATATVVALWFPGRHGLFFKSGVGVAWGQFTVPGAGADTSQGAGIGLTFGLGWDFAISRKVAVTTSFSTYVTALGDVVLPGQRVDDVIATLYQGSIGFTFR